MSTHTRRRPFVVGLLLLLLALLVVPAFAGPSPTGATIASDLADYPPGATVILTGAGWIKDEAVDIFVNDDAGQSWSLNSNPDPIADENGAFTYSFQLPVWFVANYSVTATGNLGSGTATTTFTDLSIGTYDQCSNDTGTGFTSGDTGCRWINGNLQSNNSRYAEGDATVQRLWLTEFAPGTTHTVTFVYGTTKGGKHAYDFLTTWDWSEDWITVADRCQGITGCVTASEALSPPIPADPNAGGFDVAAGNRYFTIRGGTISAVSTPTIASGTYGGDSETSITVTFTVANSGDMCVTDNKNVTLCSVALWFGAHVSTQIDWGLGQGAGAISGSPYHVALDKVDGASAGSRDNQMQANAVTFVPNGTIVIVKDAVPNDAQDFSFNLTNGTTINQNFNLDDDADPTLPNSQTFSVPPGTWTASELNIPAGWTLTNLVCVDPTSNTTVSGAVATINLASSETVVCTFTDTKAGVIITEKQTVPDGHTQSFTFDPSWSANNFNLTDGQQNNSGPLAAGAYSVSELTPPAGWSSNGGVCTSSIGDTETAANIELDAGETVTCVFTNTFAASDLTASKTATAAYTKAYAWNVEKLVDKTSVTIAQGGSTEFNYTVRVTHDAGTPSGWTVSGQITVINPNPYAVNGVSVSDAIESETNATCTVTGGSSTIAANSQAVFDYSCTYSAAPAASQQTNEATVSWTAFGSPNTSTTATMPFDWTTVTPSLTDESVNVTDPNSPNPPLPATVSYTDPSPKDFTYSKTFNGVGGTCTDYDNTATITTNDTATTDTASKTVTVCVGQDLTVTKDATASLTRTYKWLVDKSVDDTRIEIAAGGTATFNYDVLVTPDGYVDSAKTLGGTITIDNPNDFQDVTVNVVDTLDLGGTCTITEAAPYVVPAGDDLTLHYTCVTDGTTTKNTVTVTWDKDAYKTPTGSATDDAAVSFTINEVNEVITVIDDKTNPASPVTLGTWNWNDGPHTFEYSLDKQGVPGECTDYTNTAVIDETKQSDSQTVTVCVGVDLTVTKGVTASYTRTYKWLIDKSVDDTLIEIAAGGMATFNYDVKVTPNGYVDSAQALGGTITIVNPNKWQDVTVNVADSLIPAASGTCTITENGPYVVEKGKSLTLHYTCTTDGTTTKNTVNVTWDKAAAFTPNDSATDDADVTFIVTKVNDEITVIDDKTDPGNPVTLGTWKWADGEKIFEYALQKQGVAGTCTDYTNTAVIDETDQQDTQKVTVCVGADLTVSKTAVASKDRLYKWLIDKSVDDTLIEIAAGGTATFNYDVTVTPDGYVDSDFTLGGTITIVNPNDWQDITVNVADTLDKGGTCTITEAGPYVVEKGKSLTLHYTCTTDGTTTENTVDVTWDKAAYFTPTGKASDDAPVSFALDQETNKVITVIDDKTNPNSPVTLGTWNWDDGEKTFEYALEKQGVAGTCTDYTNTAVIDETDQQDTQKVTVCVGANLTISKTATPSFTRTWTWTIVKDWDHTYNLLAGGSVVHDYKVVVTPTSTDSAWEVNGTITVVNPNDWQDVTVTVTDALDNGGTCTVTGGVNVVVEKSDSVTLSYKCTYANAPDPASGTNTATATWDKTLAHTPAGSASHDKTFQFTNPTTEINPAITVDDDNLTGENWTATRAIETWTYEKKFECSTNPADYTNGTYQTVLTNTAKINQTNQTDTATVTVNCYIPSVSKTAAGKYDEVHKWTLDKTVSPASQSGFAGDTKSYEWQIVVTETETEEKFEVNGVITVINPAPIAMTVDLADALNTGTVATIAADADCDYAAGKLTIPANSTATCDYTAKPTNRTAVENTVTVTLNGMEFTASAGVSWKANVIDGEAQLTDDQIGLNKTLTAGDTFTKSEEYTCSTDVDDYTDGKDVYTENNTAELKPKDSAKLTDTASTTVNCYIPTVSKTATPTFNREFFWEIFKDVDKTLVEQVGGSAVFNYTVVVNQTGVTDSLWKVTGKITVSNPNPDAALTGVDVTDAVNNGGTCTVTGGTNVTIPAGGTKILDYECTYATAPTKANGVNTATADWSGPDVSNTANFAFDTGAAGNPTNVNKTVTVTDTFNGTTTTLGTVTGNTAEPWATRTFTYSRSITVPANGCQSYTNTARIVQTNQTDSETVTVCGPRNLGGKTIGFWSNKNGQAIIKKAVTTTVNGVTACELTHFLRQYAPFQDLSATAKCSGTNATNFVSAYVLKVIKAANASGASMNAMLKAQMLATALDVYFSDPALGGNKINAPAPIGAQVIDLTAIKGTQNVSAAFGGATSLTVSQMLAYAASQSNSGGTMWYGNVKSMQELAKNAFDAINNNWTFAP